MKKLLLLLLIILSGLTACRKELPEINRPDEYYPNTAADIFEAYWRGMNHNYVFWDIDPVNWDAVYQKYKPLFAQIDAVSSDAYNKKIRMYFSEISANLIDGYSLLYFNGGMEAINIPYERLKKRPEYHEGISADYFNYVLPERYLDQGGRTAFSGDGALNLTSGRLDGDILYYHTNNNIISDYYGSDDPADAPINEVIAYVLEEIRNGSDIKGVILDMRQSLGENTDDIPFLMGRMTDQPYMYLSTRTKNGPGRLDFGPWLPKFITPHKNGRGLKIPVVVLTNMYTVGTAEWITMAVKALPNGNGTVIGERSFGNTGQGSYIFSMTNAGTFYTDAINVYISATVTRYKDGKIYERVGFPPDITIKTDLEEIAAGNDAALEKAIAVIRSK